MTGQARERALDVAVRTALCEQAGIEPYRRPRRRAGAPDPSGPEAGGSPAVARPQARLVARVARLQRRR